MPAFNFNKRFKDRVKKGIENPSHPDAKRQTIRARRRDGRDPRQGDMLYLYAGMRTKCCEKIGEATCTSKATIAIEENNRVVIDTKVLTAREIEELATADGFKSLAEFLDYFQKEIPFYGFLYKW